jgi:hypothetical protein
VLHYFDSQKVWDPQKPKIRPVDPHFVGIFGPIWGQKCFPQKKNVLLQIIFYRFPDGRRPSKTDNWPFILGFKIGLSSFPGTVLHAAPPSAPPVPPPPHPNVFDRPNQTGHPTAPRGARAPSSEHSLLHFLYVFARLCCVYMGGMPGTSEQLCMRPRCIVRRLHRPLIGVCISLGISANWYRRPPGKPEVRGGGGEGGGAGGASGPLVGLSGGEKCERTEYHWCRHCTRMPPTDSGRNGRTQFETGRM